MNNKVVDINWQDTKMLFTIEGDEDKYYLIKADKPSAKVKLQPYDSNRYSINVINVGRKQPLEEGEWILQCKDKKNIQVHKEIEQVKKFFYQEISTYKIYDEAQYIISIKTNSYNIEIDVKIILGKGRYNAKHIIKLISFKLTSKIFNKVINDNKIVFLSSTTYIKDGNGRILMNYIKKDKQFKHYQVHQLNHDDFFNTNSIIEKLKIVCILLSSKYIFLEDHYKLIENLDFSKKTEIIQLWHAAGAYKKVGYSRFGMTNGPSLYKNAHRKYTKAIVSSRKLIPYYAEAYGIDEECIIPTGLPRIDQFMKTSHRLYAQQEIYKMFPSIKSKKVILYAPTFREEIYKGKKRYYYEYNRINFRELYEFCGDIYICIFKFHPFILEKISIPPVYQDRLIDMSGYSESINNLLYSTDILITDYSSVIFEFALLHKPIIIFGYDIEEYEQERGMYQSISCLTKASICKNFEDVIERLKDKEVNTTYQSILNNTFDDLESNACEKIVKIIFREGGRR